MSRDGMTELTNRKCVFFVFVKASSFNIKPNDVSTVSHFNWHVVSGWWLNGLLSFDSFVSCQCSTCGIFWIKIIITFERKIKMICCDERRRHFVLYRLGRKSSWKKTLSFCNVFCSELLHRTLTESRKAKEKRFCFRSDKIRIFLLLIFGAIRNESLYDW